MPIFIEVRESREFVRSFAAVSALSGVEWAEVNEWCKENGGDPPAPGESWSIWPSKFRTMVSFESERTAMAFKLRFG